MEGLNLGRIQAAVFHILPLGNQQNEIPAAQVQLAVPVVLQAVELRIVAIAPAQLDGHAAVNACRQLPGHGQLHQLLLQWHILHRLRQGRGRLQSLQQRFAVIAGDDLAVILESRVQNR